MKPLSTSETAPLRFTPQETSHKIQARSGKIGWIRSMSDQPGAKFDLTVKDALGRVKKTLRDVGTQTKESGQLLNLPTNIGEELHVEVENIRGAEHVDVFIN